ncbi:hypothetical protein BJV74DRAFT_563075 [Russula compacta]|nr:hypothetical protein BJV74DRAFT_563075 [Russula compacta]
MNPREVKVDTRGEKENRNDERKGSNDKKKHKIPAGLALMHGFSSTSVGKSRLTIEPPPNFGVFNKGRASAKIKVDELKRTENRRFPSRIFSEDRFLDSRPSKLLEERPLDSETSPSGNTNHAPSSPVKIKKSAAVQTRETPMKMKRTIRRYRPVASTQCDSEVANTDTSRAASGQRTKPTNQAEPMNSKSRARSEAWVIEQDGFSLPSTISEVSIASVKSKPETALLDVRATAWSRFLKNDLLDEKVQLPQEHHKNPQAISTLPDTTVVREAGSNAHLGLEEQATLGPWESASQVARSTLHPQEQRSANSRYFVLPHGGESRITQPIIHLAKKSSGRPVGTNDACSNNVGDTTIDEPLVYGETSVDHQGGDLLPVSVLANASPATTGFAFPEEGVSVLQPSSLDSVDRALLLEIPGITHRSRVRRRSMQWREFIPENMLYHQYGLDPTDSQCEDWGPFIHDHGHSHSKPADASNFLGDSTAPGNMHDDTLSFRGEDYTEGLEGGSEDQAGRNEYFPVTNSDLPEFASDVAHIPLNYDCRDGVPFFVGKEDTDYERVIENEEDCTGIDSVSIPSADWSALPEGDADNIHLWGDEAWPRGEAVGGNTLQEGCSQLTTVQKVEQDVARKLKGHWFPLKF